MQFTNAGLGQSVEYLTQNFPGHSSSSWIIITWICGIWLMYNVPLFKFTIRFLPSAFLWFLPSIPPLFYSPPYIQPSTKLDAIFISIDLFVHPWAHVILEKGGIAQQVKLAGQTPVPKHVVKILITDPAGLVKGHRLFLNLLLNTVEEQRGIGASLMHNVLKSGQLSVRLAVAFLSTFHVLVNFSLMAFNWCSYLESVSWWGFS